MADVPQLPEDVLIEILIRLPVKSILKLRRVSRTWRDLIRSPIFIHRHQRRERKQSVLLLKRYSTILHEGERMLSFHEPDFPELSVSPNLSIPHIPAEPIYAYTPIYGPCNGLVCIPIGEVVFLCNPALREFKLLPPLNIACPEGYRVFPLEFGFWFDPNAGTYKVIQISDIIPKEYTYLNVEEDDYMDQNHTSVDLYNSASNSWKQIDAKVPVNVIYYVLAFQVFFCGVLHWYATAKYPIEDQPYIICFDTSTEAFRLLDFPDDFHLLGGGGAMSLKVLNESLAMVRHRKPGNPPEPREIEIWVMKEYGVKESWTKQFVIGPYLVVCPLLFLNNEWLLVESKHGGLAVCALHENQFRRLPFDRMGAVVYEESLINLNDIISSDCKISLC